MAEFEVLVCKVDDVYDHPNADKLSINKIKDFICISNKTDDLKHRYSKNQLVVYVPEGAVVPEWALKKFGYWDEEKQKGYLAGTKGDRVKAIKLRNIISQGIIFPVQSEE